MRILLVVILAVNSAAPVALFAENPAKDDLAGEAPGTDAVAVQRLCKANSFGQSQAANLGAMFQAGGSAGNKKGASKKA